MLELLRSIKAALLRAVRGALHHVVAPTEHIVTLWPPFSEAEKAVYEEYLECFDHYCSSVSALLCSYWRQDMGKIEARAYHSASTESIPEARPPSRILSIVRHSSAVLLWKAEQPFHALRAFSNVLPMHITRRRYGYWLELAAALAPLHGAAECQVQELFGGAQARSTRRAAVICPGPSSQAFLDDSVKHEFDEVIVVNRVVYGEDYYNTAKRAWLCAYDPLFFSPVDSTSPPFLKALPVFLSSPGRCFVTMTYAEGFLRTTQTKHILEKTLFLAPRQGTGEWNLDLRDGLWVREAANVTLTVALPLAATLAEEIVIFGMDGAPPDLPRSWHHNRVFRYRPEQRPQSQVQVKKLLRERLEFYHNTGALVTSLTQSGCRLYVAARSHNTGLASVPIWRAH